MAPRNRSRREFIRDLGISAAATPLILNLPSLGFANQTQTKKRLVVMFSPNGVVPDTFWPDAEGKDFQFKESLKPLEPFKNQTLILHGVSDRVRGDVPDHAPAHRRRGGEGAEVGEEGQVRRPRMRHASVIRTVRPAAIPSRVAALPWLSASARFPDEST